MDDGLYRAAVPRHGGDTEGFIREYGRPPLLDFSANVSPLGIPDRVKRAAAEALETADRYPDPDCGRLREAIAEKEGVPVSRVVCGNGAADLIWRSVRAVHPREALVPLPSFFEYESALRAEGAAVRRHILREENDFALTEEILSEITPETGMLFLCEPNNPTGRLTDPALLRAIAGRCREMGTVLAVDECFLDLTSDPDGRTLRELTEEMPGLVLFRAFTKSFGMAGLRLGYCLCGSAETAEKIKEAGPPWAVSSPAQAAGLAALEEKEYLKELRELVTRERARLRAGLEGLGLRVIPGEANFLLFYSPVPLALPLRRRGILLRSFTREEGLGPGWYRAAVRGAEENGAFLRALEDVLNGKLR